MMKLRYLSLVIATLATAQVGYAATAPQAADASSNRAGALSTQKDKLSYTIGADLGHNLKDNDLSINPDMLAQGLDDALSGKTLRLTQKQMDDVLKQFQKEMLTKQKAGFEKTRKDNASQGEAFLLKNKKEKDVVTLSNGLQYKIVKEGSGVSPTANDNVTVDYEGKTISGKVFDSTYERGKPAEFKVSQVIPGWQQALTMMKPDAEWMLYIPSKLAYGERGLGGPIGPNETLIFKVHLIAVNGDKKQ